MGKYVFDVIDRKLRVRDAASLQTIWSGLIAGSGVRRAEAISGTDDCLVILEFDYAQPPRFQNLIRCRSTGSIVWRAPLPVESETASGYNGVVGDSYVNLHVLEGEIFATTWSGWRLKLDRESGSILSREFVK